MKESVSPHFQIASRELKAQRVAQYFWQTLAKVFEVVKYFLNCFVYKIILPIQILERESQHEVVKLYAS